MDNLVTDIAVAHFKDGDTCDSSSYFRGNASLFTFRQEREKTSFTAIMLITIP